MLSISHIRKKIILLGGAVLILFPVFVKAQSACATQPFPHIGFLLACVIEKMLEFAAVIALIGLIIGGYKYMAAGGDFESVEMGKKAMSYAIIGLIIIVLSVVAVRFLMERMGVTNFAFFGLNI